MLISATIVSWQKCLWKSLRALSTTLHDSCRSSWNRALSPSLVHQVTFTLSLSFIHATVFFLVCCWARCSILALYFSRCCWLFIVDRVWFMFVLACVSELQIYDSQCCVRVLKFHCVWMFMLLFSFSLILFRYTYRLHIYIYHATWNW